VARQNPPPTPVSPREKQAARVVMEVMGKYEVQHLI
jgi:hypothetical protein